MGGFEDIIAALSTSRELLAEAIRDKFGASLIADIHDPMISESIKLSLLEDDAAACIREVDALLEEMRSYGEITVQ